MSTEHFKNYIWERLEEVFTDDEMKIANKTSRNSSAVGGKAIVPKYVMNNVDKSHHILDFGAGHAAAHTLALRDAGFSNVSAHDFGTNKIPGVHDEHAMHKKYDHVFASNVLNTQSSHEMLRNTLDQIHSVVKHDGKFTGNLPLSPRKFDQLDHHLVRSELEKRFHHVEVLKPSAHGGTNKAPIFHASHPIGK
jgi:hypothetical protein